MPAPASPAYGPRPITLTTVATIVFLVAGGLTRAIPFVGLQKPARPLCR